MAMSEGEQRIPEGVAATGTGTGAGAGTSAGAGTGAGASGGAGAGAGAARGGSGRLVGVAMMCGSGLSNQVGAATGALAFPVIGPAGVVAVRQWVAGVVLLALGRPRLRSFTWRQWWPVLSLALVFATMNLSLYSAIDRIGLGLAVTLEFLGPLCVALSASRRAVDLVCALLAGSAVVALTRPQPSTDYLGIGLGLLAAVCWASYILLNRTVGSRLPGMQGSAAAALVSGLLYAPVGIVVLLHRPPTAAALAYAAVAGVLSSAVPFVTDMLALRRVPARFFGIFMSVNPVLAAVVGLVVLGETLEWAEWLAVAAIVTANTVSVLSSGRATGGPGPGGRRVTGGGRRTPDGRDPSGSGPGDRAPDYPVPNDPASGDPASGGASAVRGQAACSVAASPSER